MKIGNLYYKNGKILEVFAVESYKYKGQVKYRVLCHERFESGLIRKTIKYSIKESNFKNYTLLDWSF